MHDGSFKKSVEKELSRLKNDKHIFIKNKYGDFIIKLITKKDYIRDRTQNWMKTLCMHSIKQIKHSDVYFDPYQLAAMIDVNKKLLLNLDLSLNPLNSCDISLKKGDPLYIINSERLSLYFER